MIQALQLLLSLSILVVLHEFGHYITAKIFGCRVEKFYLFMDWKFSLFKKKIGETEFGIGWLPLGGYVKISGFIDESMDTDGVESPPENWKLRAKPAWQRLIVMLGGIVVNLILAWFIYSMILIAWGEKYVSNENLVDGISFSAAAESLGFVDGDKLISIDDESIVEYDDLMIISSILFNGGERVLVERGGREVVVKINSEDINRIIKNLSASDGAFVTPNYKWIVGSFIEGSVAEKHGIRKGDRILGINDIGTIFYTEEARKTLLLNAGKNINILVERYFKGDTLYKHIDVALDDSGMLGVNPNLDMYMESRSHTVLSSIPAGLTKTGDMISMYWGQMKTIFNPKTGGYKHVGGVISIGKMFPNNWNWYAFWSMTALLSIILAIMNLLPIPALDGGHALIAILEMISGKKIPIKVLMPLQIVGMFILFALLIYANGMDVLRLFN